MTREKRTVQVQIVLLLTLVLAIPVFAEVYNPPTPYQRVFLGETKETAETGMMRGTYKIFNGINYSMSSKNVRFQAYYSDGNGWIPDNAVVINPNQTFGRTETKKRNTGVWKLRLTSLWGKGGVARGNMWYDQ